MFAMSKQVESEGSEREQEIEEEQQHIDLGRIHASAQSLLSMIDDVLDLSHHESRRVPAEPITCDLSILAEDVCDSFRALLESDNTRARGNRFEQVIEQGIEAFTDPDKIERIALNLLSNANNFTSDGLITLTLKRSGCTAPSPASKGIVVQRTCGSCVWSARVVPLARSAVMLASPRKQR